MNYMNEMIGPAGGSANHPCEHTQPQQTCLRLQHQQPAQFHLQPAHAVAALNSSNNQPFNHPLTAATTPYMNIGGTISQYHQLTDPNDSASWRTPSPYSASAGLDQTVWAGNGGLNQLQHQHQLQYITPVHHSHQQHQYANNPQQRQIIQAQQIGDSLHYLPQYARLHHQQQSKEPSHFMVNHQFCCDIGGGDYNRSIASSTNHSSSAPGSRPPTAAAQPAQISISALTLFQAIRQLSASATALAKSTRDIVDIKINDSFMTSYNPKQEQQFDDDVRESTMKDWNSETFAVHDENHGSIDGSIGHQLSTKTEFEPTSCSIDLGNGFLVLQREIIAFLREINAGMLEFLSGADREFGLEDRISISQEFRETLTRIQISQCTVVSKIEQFLPTYSSVGNGRLYGRVMMDRQSLVNLLQLNISELNDMIQRLAKTLIGVSGVSGKGSVPVVGCDRRRSSRNNINDNRRSQPSPLFYRKLNSWRHYFSSETITKNSRDSKRNSHASNSGGSNSKSTTTNNNMTPPPAGGGGGGGGGRDRQHKLRKKFRFRTVNPTPPVAIDNRRGRSRSTMNDESFLDDINEGMALGGEPWMKRYLPWIVCMAAVISFVLAAVVAGILISQSFKSSTSK